MTLDELKAALAKSERIAKELGGSEEGFGITILWPYNPKRNYRERVRTPFGLCRIIGIAADQENMLVAVSIDQMRKTVAKIEAELKETEQRQR